jgi:type III pantothenate kinase
MILTLDIGNSTVGCGVFDQGTLKATWRLPTNVAQSGSGYGAALRAEFQRAALDTQAIEGVALCSVVPALTPVFEELISRLFGVRPLLASAELDTGLVLRYTDPRELGTDRLVGAAAAYARYQAALIVVDLGTATTFSVVNEKGEYLGGAIAPGLGISAEALASRTAQLPAVDLLSPPAAIARDTRSGIQSGLLFGHAALVDGLVLRMQGELGQTARIVATGGLAPIVMPLSTTMHEHRPFLTLEGLDWLFRRLHLKEKS